MGYLRTFLSYNAGQKKVHVHVASAAGEPQRQCRDEIKLYLDGRYLCAMDAMWRILGYQTYPSCEPTVQTVKIKTPDQVRTLLADGKSCDMLAYINRPASLHHLKYSEMFNSYLSGESTMTRTARISVLTYLSTLETYLFQSPSISTYFSTFETY
jgi:hypothetical protein